MVQADHLRGGLRAILVGCRGFRRESHHGNPQETQQNRPHFKGIALLELFY